MVYLGGVFRKFLGNGVDTRVFICEKVWGFTGIHHWWECSFLGTRREYKPHVRIQQDFTLP